MKYFTKVLVKALLYAKNNPGDRRFRHDSPVADSTDTDDFLGINVGREHGQSGSERIDKYGLSKRRGLRLQDSDKIR